MVHLLGCSVINMYSMGACAVLGISDQDALSEDLQNDPFQNSALQRATCELYYRFGLFLAPLSTGIITSRHYYMSIIKMENKNEQVEQLQREEWGTQQSEVMGPERPRVPRDPKRELLSSIGLFIGMGLLGFWFGVGAALGAKMVNSLEEFISIK